MTISIHPEFNITSTSISCGCRLVYNIQSLSEEQFKRVINGSLLSNTHNSFRQDYTYIFSDTNFGNGSNLAKWIVNYGLGQLTETGWHLNPNSGNTINVWTWVYNGNKIPEEAK